MSDPEQPVEVARFRYRHEAELAAGYLRDAEIEVGVFMDDAGGAHGGMAFAAEGRLLVGASERDRAVEILRSVGYGDQLTG